jgi:hypothetical protein
VKRAQRGSATGGRGKKEAGWAAVGWAGWAAVGWAGWAAAGWVAG